MAADSRSRAPARRGRPNSSPAGTPAMRARLRALVDHLRDLDRRNFLDLHPATTPSPWQFRRLPPERAGVYAKYFSSIFQFVNDGNCLSGHKNLCSAYAERTGSPVMFTKEACG